MLTDPVRHAWRTDFDLDAQTLAAFVRCETDYRPLGARFGLDDERVCCPPPFPPWSLVAGNCSGCYLECTPTQNSGVA